PRGVQGTSPTQSPGGPQHGDHRHPAWQPEAPVTTYRAAVVHSFRDPLTVEQVPATADLPFIPGHEGVGIVAELGPGVSEVSTGDRVAMPWLGYACGTCDYCVSGWETLCESQQHMGYSIGGGFGEYATA